MNALSRFGWSVLVVGYASVAMADETPCPSCMQPVCYQRTNSVEETQPSWIFNRSTYSHDPMTGARVAQYQRIAPVEPLDDERNVTSRYRRIQTNLPGTNGSMDTTYEVQAWGNGRGGLDAEWERFHNAWKESYLQNGFSTQNGRPWGWGNGGWNNGWNGGGNWNGGGWNGGGPWNGGGWNGGGWGGGGWGGGGPWNGGGPGGGAPGPWQGGGPGPQGP